MEIYILEQNLDRVGTLDNYESFIWETKYNEVGAFQLNCSIEYFGLLKTDRIIQCTEDLKHNGIIEHVLKVTNDDGSESLQIKGRMAEALLDRRIVKGSYAYESQQPSEIVADMIRKNAIEDRPIFNLEIGELVNAPEGVIDYAGANQSLLSEIVNICSVSLIGFQMYADTDEKKWIFETYLGTNRTEEDNTVTHIEENTIESLLNNPFFSSGFDGWTEYHNYRGYDDKREEYISDYPLKIFDGVVSKEKVYDYWEVEDHKWDIVWKAAAYLTQSVNLNAEHMYYMSARCRNPLDAVLSFGIKETDTFYLNFEKSSEWAKKGCLFVPSKSGRYQFYAGFGEIPERMGQYAYWDDCILVDLTATFGAGNEPTLDYCNRNIYFKNEILMYKTEIIEFVENFTPPLIFSRDRDTLLTVEYERSIVNECNYLFVHGDGIDIVIDDNAEEVKEKYIDLSSEIPRTVDGVQIPEASYTAMLKKRAMATKRQLVVNEIIDGTLYKLSNKKFARDFYLGDIGSFTDKAMDYVVNLRITSAQQVWDTNGYNVTVTLGDDIPNIIDTIKLVGKGAK